MPQPDEPTRPTVCPPFTLNEILSRICVPPYLRRAVEGMDIEMQGRRGKGGGEGERERWGEEREGENENEMLSRV